MSKEINVLDQSDNLAHFRDKFHIPKDKNGKDSIYLCGNSLGLMPVATSEYINQELEDWKKYGVEGHFHAKNPWMPYHELLSGKMAKIVGAKSTEVIVMNSLTVNLHLMMVSFYRPTKKRYRILMEYAPFPSDRYAINSQIRFHGYDPEEAIISLRPEHGTELVSDHQIEKIIRENGEEIALVLLCGVNYYTGQSYDLKKITTWGHAYGCKVGFDLAHGAGNIDYALHDDDVDFAVWCTYKYLNSGPGSLSGCFIHERHHKDDTLPRFEGWWGNDKASRFLMKDNFESMHTAESWQLSNPPILSMAAINASLDIFDEATMPLLRQKSILLTDYLENQVEDHGLNNIDIITPKKSQHRGCQLSFQMKKPDKRLFHYLISEGVIADWREPDVIRVAPVPLYNTFQDMDRFVKILVKGIKQF